MLEFCPYDKWVVRVMLLQISATVKYISKRHLHCSVLQVMALISFDETKGLDWELLGPPLKAVPSIVFAFGIQSSLSCSCKIFLDRSGSSEPVGVSGGVWVNYGFFSWIFWRVGALCVDIYIELDRCRPESTIYVYGNLCRRAM